MPAGQLPSASNLLSRELYPPDFELLSFLTKIDMSCDFSKSIIEVRSVNGIIGKRKNLSDLDPVFVTVTISTEYIVNIKIQPEFIEAVGFESINLPAKIDNLQSHATFERLKEIVSKCNAAHEQQPYVQKPLWIRDQPGFDETNEFFILNIKLPHEFTWRLTVENKQKVNVYCNEVLKFTLSRHMRCLNFDIYWHVGDQIHEYVAQNSMNDWELCEGVLQDLLNLMQPTSAQVHFWMTMDRLTNHVSKIIFKNKFIFQT